MGITCINTKFNEIIMDKNIQEEQANLKDEQQFLISVEDTLDTVKRSIHKFITDVPQALANSGLDLDLEKLNIENDQKIQDPISDQTNKEEKEKISALNMKCDQLQSQLQLQINRNKKAEEEIEYLREQILNQSTYCATLGAVLGNLTWRASRFPEIVDVWLSGFQHMIGEFLSITDGSFVAFINTYRNAFPPTCNVEYQFIIGLLGIVTNISATPEGREFLITDTNGKAFVQKMVKLMPTLPLSQGSLSLKRLMLMIFYNVSMNKTGLQYLFESRVSDVLDCYLRNNSLPDETQFLCLRVLQSMTYGLMNPKYIQDLTNTLPISRIENIATSNKNEMSAVAKQVIKQLRDSHKFIHMN
ncbi:heat shock factor 2-binding protein-like [Frieseomelitta varia]|uniref:heat shock factor 2-binding protein-like n=1 Tax=Frieseomelitta varia TaxID=561572 RepID=UPI001CB6A00F|nr:heat shock factor 2-binding protein-like [Frieseomelitta varia]